MPLVRGPDGLFRYDPADPAAFNRRFEETFSGQPTEWIRRNLDAVIDSGPNAGVTFRQLMSGVTGPSPSSPVSAPDPPDAAPPGTPGARDSFDAWAGFAQDQLDLDRQGLLAGTQAQQVDASTQIANLGARLLELEAQLRGPQNAIQYSNLTRGLEGGDYPEFLRKIAGLSFRGTDNPNPMLGAVDLNALPDEFVGNAPGVLRAFDPNAVDVRSVRNLDAFDTDLYRNFAESAGLDWGQLQQAIARFMPRGTALGAARVA